MGPFFNTLTADRCGAGLCGARGRVHPAGRRPGAGGGGGPAVAIHTTTVQRMAVQRQVDLAGTLLSPDQAKVSAEAAGVVRDVLVRDRPRGPRRRSAGQARAARAGAGAGPRRKRAAADPRPARHARSARRRRHAAARRSDRIGARTRWPTATTRAPMLERAKTLAGRGLIVAGRSAGRRHAAEGRRGRYQSAVDTVRGQKALLQDRRAAYDLAVKKLDDAVVRAPIAGVVSERPVQSASSSASARRSRRSSRSIR